jgi:purine-binding chemotaxis protein CheW
MTKRKTRQNRPDGRGKEAVPEKASDTQIIHAGTEIAEQASSSCSTAGETVAVTAPQEEGSIAMSTAARVEPDGGALASETGESVLDSGPARPLDVSMPQPESAPPSDGAAPSATETETETETETAQLPEPGSVAVQYAAALMPQDSATRKVLEERARALAKPAGQQQQHELRDQYLRFRLGAVERYGIPYPYLEELLYVGNLARVPCTPAFVAGVVNYRGELLTILDPKQFFRMPALAFVDEARIIVVKHAGMRVGLLVDAVDGNEEYQDSELSPPLSSEGVSNMEYVLGIHDGCVTLLNLKALLDDPALRVSR